MPKAAMSRSLRVSIMVAAALSLSACQSAREKGDALAQTAQLMFEAGRLEEAGKAIAEAIAQRDDVVGYYLLQGQIAAASGSFIPAFRAYQAVLDLDPSNKEALSYVANIGLRIGQVDQAQKAADRLVSLDPQSVSALQVQGLVALQRQHVEDAEKAADRILLISPNDEGGTLIRARVLALAGKMDEAEALIRKTSAVIGTSPAMVTTLLNIARRQQDPAKMASLYPQLLAKMPDDMNARLDYAVFLYKTGHAAQARALTIDILRAAGSRRETGEKVVRLWAEFDNAPLTQSELAQLARSDLFAVQAVMRHLLLSGQPDLVLQFAAQVGRTADSTINGLIGRAQMEKGLIPAARGVEQAVQKHDSDSTEGLLLQSQLALYDRQFDIALQRAQVALSQDPLNPATYAILAQAYLAKRLTLRAVQIMDDGRKRLPQNHYLANVYEDLLIKMGQRSRAISVARDFIADSPSSVRAWARLASLCNGYDMSCVADARAGQAQAARQYQLDDPPGTLPDRGLLGKI